MMYHDKLYAVKNDRGEFAHIEMDELTWETGFATVWLSLNKPYAEHTSSDYGGHVVELAEAPAKIVVNAEEAKMLEWAKGDSHYAASVIAEYVVEHSDDYGLQNRVLVEDRLMRAYVIGWVVEKQKRYVLPMPGTEYHNLQMHGNAQYYAVKGANNWRPDAIALGTDDAVEHGYTVAQADIDAAPDWVRALKPVEVTDDEQ